MPISPTMASATFIIMFDVWFRGNFFTLWLDSEHSTLTPAVNPPRLGFIRFLILWQSEHYLSLSGKPLITIIMVRQIRQHVLFQTNRGFVWIRFWQPCQDLWCPPSYYWISLVTILSGSTRRQYVLLGTLYMTIFWGWKGTFLILHSGWLWGTSTYSGVYTRSASTIFEGSMVHEA